MKNKTRKTVGNICLLAGIVLLLAALSLVLFNLHEDKRSGERAGEILAELKEIIPDEAMKNVAVIKMDVIKLSCKEHI